MNTKNDKEKGVMWDRKKNCYWVSFPLIFFSPPKFSFHLIHRKKWGKYFSLNPILFGQHFSVDFLFGNCYLQCKYFYNTYYVSSIEYFKDYLLKLKFQCISSNNQLSNSEKHKPGNGKSNIKIQSQFFDFQNSFPRNTLNIVP